MESQVHSMSITLCYFIIAKPIIIPHSFCKRRDRNLWKRPTTSAIH